MEGSDLARELLGRTIVDVQLDEIEDGYAILTFDDDSRLEIRTTRVGDLLFTRGG